MLSQQSRANISHTDLNEVEQSPFQVRRGRAVPTLASVGADKEQLNNDTKSEERGETDNDVFKQLRLLSRSPFSCEGEDCNPLF